MSNQRQTRQGQIIRRFLKQNKGREMTVAEIAGELEDSGSEIGVATVYRAVRRLESEGVLVKTVSSTNSKALYRYAETDETVRSMQRIFCNFCGKAVDIPWVELERFERKIADVSGFSITDHQILLYGVCENCK